MTNAQIIFNESVSLMKEGKIGTTGRELQIETASGEIITIMEPEPIHTYAAWKSLGYQVNKGAKAVASFTIWKHTSRKNEETEEDESRMFMKKASFFTRAQVTKIELAEAC